jgi:hypothetical protein
MTESQSTGNFLALAKQQKYITAIIHPATGLAHAA